MIKSVFMEIEISVTSDARHMRREVGRTLPGLSRWGKISYNTGCDRIVAAM